jgi:hypothetical protein
MSIYFTVITVSNLSAPYNLYLCRASYEFEYTKRNLTESSTVRIATIREQYTYHI